MKYPYAIFDLDGTLLDSMPAWQDLGSRYLRSKKISPPENLRQILSAGVRRIRDGSGDRGGSIWLDASGV